MNDLNDGIDPQWYLSAFGDAYLDVYRKRTDDQGRAEVDAVLARLDLAPGARVLDLACGAGRHLDPLLDHDLDAVGLDRSPVLLERAAARLADRGHPRGRVVLGDMRRLPFAPEFDAVLSFFTSFGYFLVEGENRRVLGEASRVLKPGGWLVLDLMDKATVVAGLVPESRRAENGRELIERRWIREDGKRVEKAVVVVENQTERRYTESVRLYEPDEIRAELEAHGLRIESYTGDLFGAEHRSGESPRMVVWARRVTRDE